MLIIDEAHKFVDAARAMYGAEFSSDSVLEIYSSILQLNFRHNNSQNLSLRAAKKLSDENIRLFKSLGGLKNSAIIPFEAVRHIRNIRDIADRLIFILHSETFYRKAEEFLAWLRGKYVV